MSELAEMLEQRLGESSVFYDEWFPHYLAGDDADLKLHDIYGQRCQLVVVCVCEIYAEKPWTQAEHRAIRSRQLATTDERRKHDVLPIRVGPGDMPGVLANTIVPDYCQDNVSETVELILARLKLATGYIPEDEDQSRPWPDAEPDIDWNLANHKEVQTAFGQLISQSSPWRYLSLRGPSGVGKSHITKQMRGTALRNPDIACGRLNLKGTSDLSLEFTGFVQGLGIEQPPDDKSLNQQLGLVFDELEARKEPTLLIFDTYESAGLADQWIRHQLLSALIRSSWLRVVIAGQVVPPVQGQIWEAESSPVIDLNPPHPEDWFEYGRRYKAGLEIGFVRQVCELNSGPALLSQLLGPSD